ncbi:MAG TPA: PDZ domain-containing protein, partial [Rhizobiaceae bacterium]|nr:PDZ domain-containing protein [Rhizobiaceae bacterium]
IAFAIPVSVLTRIAAELIETGGVLRGEAGLTVQQLDPTLAEGLGLDRTAAGLAVATVKAGGAAARSGIAVGDILVSCGATPLAEPADLGKTLLWSKPGERVSVSLLRNGATLISTVLELDPAQAVAAPRIEVATRGMPQRLDFGARFRPGAGLTVSEVTPQGAADRAGLLEGDRILAAAGRPMADPAAFEALWRDFGRPSMTLLVMREGDDAQYIAVSCYENADGLSGNVTASPPVAF